jgi:cytochrome c-type biogenesis protein CcmE
MTPRHQRMLLAAMVVAGVGLAITFALRAFQDNLLFFYTPTQVLAGEVPAGRKFRLGGMVEKNSLRREPGQLQVQFTVTDMSKAMNVSYSGVLPDLFREEQGVIALGYYDTATGFRAEEVLAKHDENYMPPEVADSLKKAGKSPEMPSMKGQGTQQVSVGNDT